MGVSERKALLNHLANLIAHIIKWYIQPWKRTASWKQSIKNARDEVFGILKDNPSLKNMIDVLLPKAFMLGTKKAENETGLKSTKKDITKKELFDDDYKLDE